MGLCYLLKYGRNAERFRFHGACVTKWNHSGGISLGMFIFIGDPLLSNGEPGAYLTHEYGHTLQSLLLGPLYLFLVGLPSARWAKKYTLEKLDAGISYFSVFPENWANRLGEKVTGISVPPHIPRSLLEDS